MSGLAVVFHRDGRPADPSALEAMLGAVPYRATDGSALALFGSLGLGYAKLAVTPEDAFDRQPLISARTGCAIVADARLDNRAELLAWLPDLAPAEASDAEIILRAYEAWGLDAVDWLVGDFAFAIWDPREERLVCGRDPSGQRHLYYRADSGTFAAASEIHQLLQDPAVAVAPNLERILDSLAPATLFRNPKDDARTFYAGIHALPAGHLLILRRGTIAVRAYWELEPRGEIRYRTDDEYAEHYRELFFEAVRARLRSAYPVGVLLSGGLDSSSVACAAQELYRRGRAVDRGFTSFSVTFDGLECDESGLIRDVQAKYGFSARFVPSGARVRSLDPEPGGFMPRPGKPESELDCLLPPAAEAGVRALLSGDVADACVYGSPLVFDSLLRQLRVAEGWRRLRQYRRASGESWPKILGLYCAAPLLPLPVHNEILAARARVRYRRAPTSSLPDWMPEGLRRELGRRELGQALALERSRRFASPARERDRQLLSPPEVANDVVGWPIQVVRPYADRRLHEFLLAIPPEQKYRPHPDTDDVYAGAKHLVRRAMRGILPESVRTRTRKTIFASMFEAEIRRDWPTYEAVFGPSARSEVAALGLVDPASFWERLNYLRLGFWGTDFLYITRIIWLETWLRSLARPRSRQVTVRRATVRQATVQLSSGLDDTRATTPTAHRGLPAQAARA